MTIKASPVTAITALRLLVLAAGLQLSCGAQESTSADAPSAAAWLWGLLVVFLGLCAAALVLFVLVVLFLLWRAKKMIENAARPDLPRLRAELERLHVDYPQLDDDQLALKIVTAKSHRAGFVGFITGFGGLPLLPIMLPIDLAMTIKTQSEMVHLLRLLKTSDGVSEDDFLAQAGLWALSSGSLRLTSASTTAMRELVLKAAAQSLVKFVPLLGGVIGYTLSWLSTQAMGRGALRWWSTTTEGKK